MATFMTPASDTSAIQENAFPAKPAIAFALAALSDWLFYGQRIGISAVIFAIALTCGSLLANFAGLNKKHAMLAGIFVLAGLVPAIEQFNAVSLAFIVLALGVGLLLTTGRELDDLGERTAALFDLFAIGPFRFFREAIGVFSLPALTSGFTVWFIPVVLGSIFVFLFVSANPLLEKWISLMNPSSAASYVSIGRLLFWAVALSVVWPFVHVWWRAKTEVMDNPAVGIPQEHAEPADFADFFGIATILRSLILFNLLFAVQTVLDIVYLWGNAALPADITYAAYAHRGAYPLILTALLAAGFVLAAMQPGGPAS
jgi:hypothetical protein